MGAKATREASNEGWAALIVPHVADRSLDLRGMVARRGPGPLLIQEEVVRGA